MSTPRRLNKDDTEIFFEYGLHLPTRTLYCGNEVSDDGTEAELFLKGMRLLNAGEGDITVVLNNIGGDEYHGLAMFDAIATSLHRVEVCVYGAAFSMGSWIMQAADHRVMSPNATLLLHYGSWGRGVDVASEERMQADANEGQRIRRLMEACYLAKIRQKHPTFREEELKRLLSMEAYIPAQEAARLGLADEVLEQ